MKKTILLLVAFTLLLTGCQKNEEKKEDKKQDNQKTTEPAKPEFISATYMTQDEFEPGVVESLNDDFYVFNEDGTFYRQNNFCACYYINEGTYEIVAKDGKKIINLRPNNDIERHLEYKGDKITFIDETGDDDKKSSEYHQGCNFFMNDFAKTDSKNVVYKKAECSE